MGFGLFLAVLFSLSINVYAEEKCKLFDENNPEGQITVTGFLKANPAADNQKDIRFILESEQSFLIKSAQADAPSKCSSKTYTLDLSEESQGLAKEVIEQGLKVEVTGFLHDSISTTTGIQTSRVQTNQLSVVSKL